jgi:potassium large conductance calcium-activated channel subfamily M alpha protein 1
MAVVLSARIPNQQEDSTLADKEALLASLNIKAMNFDCTLASMGSLGIGEPPLVFQRAPVQSGSKIPMITELGRE